MSVYVLYTVPVHEFVCKGEEKPEKNSREGLKPTETDRVHVWASQNMPMQIYSTISVTTSGR